MDQLRLDAEKGILQKYFPNRFVFVLNTSESYLDVGIQTNSKKTYRLKIVLASDYPASLPRVYVTSPSPLRDYQGKKLTKHGVSGPMHLLTPDGDAIQLCHFVPGNWNDKQSLYKVIMKCRVWLEAYEGHLRTGNSLDYFLSHKKIG